MDHDRGGAAADVSLSAEEIERRELQIQMEGCSIRSDACPDTPKRLTVFNDSYIIPFPSDVQERKPQDSKQRARTDYKKQLKAVQKCRSSYPYSVPKNKDVDYRFWNEFHSDYYQSVLFNSKKSKIHHMKYIDWSYLESMGNSDVDDVIAACKRFNLYNLMGFKYDWNREIILQFFATYYCNSETDEIHWLTEGRHYKMDFVTFARLLGFGKDDRGYSDLHDERTLRNNKITFIYENPKSADGFVKGLKSFYYVLNNLFRQTINPKGGSDSNLYAYVKNILARMGRDGDHFSVSRFLWNGIQQAAEDSRKALPYAPFFMFIIERATGYTFIKDGGMEHMSHSGLPGHST